MAWVIEDRSDPNSSVCWTRILRLADKTAPPFSCPSPAEILSSRLGTGTFGVLVGRRCFVCKPFNRFTCIVSRVFPHDHAIRCATPTNHLTSIAASNSEILAPPQTETPMSSPQPPFPPTVIIFDWDDTICPSSFVDQCKVDTFTELPIHYQNIFLEIGKCAEKCLEAAAKYGEVILITNSDDGWVHYSAERYVPNLLPVLPKYRIVSARTRYERFYPGQPLCWKAAAFAHEVNEIYSTLDDAVNKLPSQPGLKGKENHFPPGSEEDEPDLADTSCESLDSMILDGFGDGNDDSTDDSMTVDSPPPKSNTFCLNPFSRKAKAGASSKKGPSSKSVAPKHSAKAANLRREIISFGDSMEERTAVKIVSGQLDSLPKSVMFLTNPNPLQLIGQLTMLTGHMKFVCGHDSTLDLEIAPHQADKCAMSVLEGNKPLARAWGKSCGYEAEGEQQLNNNHNGGEGSLITAERMRVD